MLEKTPFPYGAGFRSLDRKTLDPVRLSVRAELPSWLEEALLSTNRRRVDAALCGALL